MVMIAPPKDLREPAYTTEVFSTSPINYQSAESESGLAVWQGNSVIG
jgi:hypothetical protein